MALGVGEPFPVPCPRFCASPQVVAHGRRLTQEVTELETRAFLKAFEALPDASGHPGEKCRPAKEKTHASAGRTARCKTKT